jgi:hypothetical protein
VSAPHNAEKDTSLRVGSAIHGFANGYFGRDSYTCRVIEAEGSDWFVTRNTSGVAEFITKADAAGIRDPEDRAYCEGEWGGTCILPPGEHTANDGGAA